MKAFLNDFCVGFRLEAMISPDGKVCLWKHLTIPDHARKRGDLSPSEPGGEYGARREKE